MTWFEIFLLLLSVAAAFAIFGLVEWLKSRGGGGRLGGR